MKTYLITEYGAVSGEKCTQAIQRALDAADAAGGETVVIPRGRFITGTLNLKSASLHLEKGAVLVGSPDYADYRWTGYDHNEMGKATSLLYSQHTSGLLIDGQGTLDLNGNAFYDFEKRAIPKSVKPLTPEQIEECTATYVNRPTQPIFFYDCKNITVRGITVLNSSCWTFAFIECENVHMLDLEIDTDRRVPNNDGMHFCSCKDVFVRGCRISSGDDCIALSCITDWNKPCENVVISDCILRSSSKAVVIGYMHSIVRNVTLSNCVILDSNRAFCVMSSTVGIVENVLVQNVRLDTRVRAGNWWGNGEAVCVMGTFHNLSNYRDAIPQRPAHPCIRGIRFQNLICTTENALAVVGDPGAVCDVHFDGLSVTLKDSDNLDCVKGRVIDISPSPNTDVLPDSPTWLYVRGASNVTVSHATISPFHGANPTACLKDAKEIRIQTEALPL